MCRWGTFLIFYIVLISVCLINLLGGVLADKIFIDLWNLLELKRR